MPTAVTARRALPGYDASRGLRVEHLEDAGYDATVQAFELRLLRGSDSDGVRSRSPRRHHLRRRHRLRHDDVQRKPVTSTGDIEPVDLVVDDPAASQQRLRTRRLRRIHCGEHRARAAGRLQLRREGHTTPKPPEPIAAIIFNQGNTPDRANPCCSARSAPLGAASRRWEPSTAIGVELQRARRHGVSRHDHRSTRSSSNVLAETIRR